jgi:hypothetical protein
MLGADVSTGLDRKEGPMSHVRHPGHRRIQCKWCGRTARWRIGERHFCGVHACQLAVLTVATPIEALRAP